MTDRGTDRQMDKQTDTRKNKNCERFVIGNQNKKRLADRDADKQTDKHTTHTGQMKIATVLSNGIKKIGWRTGTQTKKLQGRAPVRVRESAMHALAGRARASGCPRRAIRRASWLFPKSGYRTLVGCPGKARIPVRGVAPRFH